MNGNDQLFAGVGDDILLRPLVKTSARYYFFVLFPVLAASVRESF